MEKEDELIISKYIESDDELRKYVEDHKRLETELEGFNKRVYLTPEEEMEKKKLQKRKLLGKDRIHEILSRYRQN
ncbi:MAG: DUF465 domain-containing protein [Syntrophaceae bacterium]